MGMFDTIIFHCPECGSRIEAQSKSGECLLREYYCTAVPADVAADANRHAPHQCKCGCDFELRESNSLKNITSNC